MSARLRQQCWHRAQTAPVYHVARRSPLGPASLLSERLGHQVWLKREDLQKTFSFKLRGAYTRLATCRPGTIAVAASAGNHAQGVALAASRLGMSAEIVMPRTTPEIKVSAVRHLGAIVHLLGDDYDGANQAARLLAQQLGGELIHPFDDADVIAGQATIGLELLDQCRQRPEKIYIPVGGGGLIAGIATVVKARWPDTHIIAVEPKDAACLAAALSAGRPVPLDYVGLFADGVAVRQIGDLPFALVEDLVDEVITVDADAICAAIHDIFIDTRALVEPAGALAVAGLTQHAASGSGGQCVAVVSGANINFDRLAHVVERSEMGRGHEALLAVTIPERAGSFLTFCRALDHRAITEFNYRYAHPQHAQVFVGLRLSAEPQRQEAAQRLAAAGYDVCDLSDNELARQHVRHMVGGVLPGSGPSEVLVRFRFPERPGALEEFLTKLAGRWNISLFHYRNHGAASGRVLVGFMVPSSDHGQFHGFLDSTGYLWYEETDNPAYRQFLAPHPALQVATA